jgi:hypothetical protein
LNGLFAYFVKRDLFEERGKVRTLMQLFDDSTVRLATHFARGGGLMVITNDMFNCEKCGKKVSRNHICPTEEKKEEKDLNKDINCILNGY